MSEMDEVARQPVSVGALMAVLKSLVRGEAMAAPVELSLLSLQGRDISKEGFFSQHRNRPGPLNRIS